MQVINLWGGPGSGKSTTAAGLFSLMKLQQKKVELVTEFAKDLTYEENFISLSNQFAVSGQQDHRLRRLIGHVDYVITDSPLLLGMFYASGVFQNEWFTNCLLGAFNSYNNRNFFIKRVKPYVKLGRTQSEQEAETIGDRMLETFDKYQFSFEIVDGDEHAAQTIYNMLFPVLASVH